MTHSAGQRGYKISASSASRDQRRYSFDARDRDDMGQQNEMPAAESDTQQSTQNRYRNSGSESTSRRNK